MEILTIGSSGRSAEAFFEALRAAGVRRVVDIRLRNEGQLLAYSMKRDLPYLLRSILGAEYEHRPEMAPSPALFALYRAGGKGWWERYETGFQALLAERKTAKLVPRSLFDVPAALLCSCAAPARCHRRLVAEHLAARWKGATIRHL